MTTHDAGMRHLVQEWHASTDLIPIYGSFLSKYSLMLIELGARHLPDGTAPCFGIAIGLIHPIREGPAGVIFAGEGLLPTRAAVLRLSWIL